MPRRLKPAKPGTDTKPKKAAERVEARRSIVLRLMLQGLSPRQMVTHLNTEFPIDPDTRKPRVNKKGEVLRNPDYFPCSKDTVEDDRRAMLEEVRKAWDDERASIAAVAGARMEDIYVRSLQIAQKASQADKFYAQVQALSAARQVLMDKAKLAGVIVEKQEHSGVITNRNVDAEASPEDIAAARRALEQAS